MVIAWIDGLYLPAAPKVVAWSFVVRGLGGDEPLASCGALDLEKASHHVAEYVALGKLLALLAEEKAAVAELKILGDTKFVLDHFASRAAGGPELIVYRERCAVLAGAFVCPKSVELIPPELNVEAAALARAAYIGRTGRLVPPRTKG